MTVTEGNNMAATETIGAARAVAFWTGLRASERQVGAAMAEGWTNAEIAKRLSFSPRTVEKRVQTIYDQLPDFPDLIAGSMPCC